MISSCILFWIPVFIYSFGIIFGILDQASNSKEECVYGSMLPDFLASMVVTGKYAKYHRESASKTEEVNYRQ